ncbi:hypothetical protein HHL28_14460 [Aerophototrophica crusticola]|uniref:DifB protein n=1 Tax=Aerophototrophica crusticola TaxID=1709002 RepID=A0A858R926_9PROT|nr:hypothetical protein HHL28_14460 [Rhodospirillaceae bacterium B3]
MGPAHRQGARQGLRLLRPAGDGSLRFSVKLPQTAPEALSLPFCTPTGYGLGKAGWVTVRFTPGEEVLLGWLKAWIGESYRAVAPKKLVKALDGAN